MLSTLFLKEREIYKEKESSLSLSYIGIDTAPLIVLVSAQLYLSIQLARLNVKASPYTGFRADTLPMS